MKMPIKGPHWRVADPETPHEGLMAEITDKETRDGVEHCLCWVFYRGKRSNRQFEYRRDQLDPQPSTVDLSGVDWKD